MRQSGVLAATGLFALEHHLAYLAGDHDRADTLGTALRQMGAGNVTVASNMVFLTPARDQLGTLQEFLGAKGIRIGSQQPTTRMALHRDVTDRGLEETIAAFQECFEKLA